MNSPNASRRVDAGGDFPNSPLLQSSSPSKQDWNMFSEESMTALNQLQANWDQPLFYELPHHEMEVPFSPGSSLEENALCLRQPENMGHVVGYQHVPSLYRLNTGLTSCPSSPDCNTPGSQSSGLFPGLADMRFEAGILNYGGKVNDASKEQRRLERRRERNRASQRAFRKRREKYVQDLESHYLELRRRYDGLLVVLSEIRKEGVGSLGGCCGAQQGPNVVRAMSNTEVEIA